MKLAFDEEVTPENVDVLRKLIHKIRHPPDVFHHFAFAGQVVMNQTPLHKGKEKNATLLGISKKTLLKTARKAGFKQKSSSKRQKYVLPNMSINSSKYMTSPGRMNLPLSDDFNHEDDLSIDDYESVPQSNTPVATDAKTLERLAERTYVKDWRRLGLTNSNSPTSSRTSPDAFRLTSVNSIYMMCRR